MIIDRPGIYDIPADIYHSDPCPEPSLSSSIIKVMAGKSAAHAWAKHPRSGAAVQDDDEDDGKFDLGSAAHDLLLGEPARFVVVNQKDWRKAEAKRQRAEAWDAGKLPLLAKQWKRTQAMVAAARAQIEQIAADPDDTIDWDACVSEKTLVWREGDVWCRARVDRMPIDLVAGRRTAIPVLDYKTTQASAHPDDAHRIAYANGWHIQEAWYRRGIRAVLGVDRVEFRFLVQEWARPFFPMTPIGLKSEWLHDANKDIDRALVAWRQSLNSGQWPAYPRKTCWLDAPTWMRRTAEDRAARDEWARQNDTDLNALAIQWQAPFKEDAA